MNINDVGQLFITGITGKSLEDKDKIFLEKENIGGVIYFSHNFQSPAQIAELTNQIQVCRDEFPLFISVDQEGGRVIRFKEGFIQLPAMFKLGEIDSPKLTFEVHSLLGHQLRACGINLNFSPCCDIWSNPNNNVIGDRAFGNNIQLVERHISAAIRGLQTASVIACAKHFPGHGDTLKDSHFDLPYVTKSMDQLESFEIIPFQKAVKSRVDFFMMSHLVVDAFNKDKPTTLSRETYEYVRKKLKFSKVIVSDDMEMKAILNNYTVEEAAILALEAGADILIYRSQEKCEVAYHAVKKALKDKRLKLSLIEEKIRRIYSVKKSYLSGYSPIYLPDISKNMKLDQAQSLLEKIEPSQIRQTLIEE